MHPSHFYTSSSQGWEKCLVKVSFKSVHFARFGRALKKCAKIAYFCTPEELLRKIHHMACLHCKKKTNARTSNLLFQSTFEFAISHELWSRRGGVTPHHTAPMPQWRDRRQHFGHRLISRKLTLRCGVVASLARPIPIGLFPSGYVKAKRTHVREPLTVIEFKIVIARESPRSPPISTAAHWTTTGTSDFCRFLHISLSPTKAGKVSRFG